MLNIPQILDLLNWEVLKVKAVKVTGFHTMMFCLGVLMVLESDEGLPHMLRSFHNCDHKEVITASDSTLKSRMELCEKQISHLSNQKLK